MSEPAPAATELERLFSPRELSGLWSTREDTIRKWARSGRLRSVRIGGLVRIPESALREFLAGGGK